MIPRRAKGRDARLGRYPVGAMADKDTIPDTDDPVARHPLASRMQRAIQAHPILKLQKKIDIRLEGERVVLSGTVYTINMLRQLNELVQQVAAEDNNYDMDVLAEIQPPAGRTLEGRVPPVSPGAGATKSNFSTNHLKK